MKKSKRSKVFTFDILVIIEKGLSLWGIICCFCRVISYISLLLQNLFHFNRLNYYNVNSLIFLYLYFKMDHMKGMGKAVREAILTV